jgi:hypothetical protein
MSSLFYFLEKESWLSPFSEEIGPDLILAHPSKHADKEYKLDAAQ